MKAVTTSCFSPTWSTFCNNQVNKLVTITKPNTKLILIRYFLLIHLSEWFLLTKTPSYKPRPSQHPLSGVSHYCRVFIKNAVLYVQRNSWNAKTDFHTIWYWSTNKKLLNQLDFLLYLTVLTTTSHKRPTWFGTQEHSHACSECMDAHAHTHALKLVYPPVWGTTEPIFMKFYTEKFYTNCQAFQFSFRSLILKTHLMSRTTWISPYICSQAAKKYSKNTFRSEHKKMFTYLFMSFLYRNDFGVHEHGSFGRMIC
jgi:hypothetical protein